MCTDMRPSIEYSPTHRLFQRLRRDFPSIFQVRWHACCPKSAIPLTQSAVNERLNSAVMLRGTAGIQNPGCMRSIRSIRPSTFGALQVEQSEGQIESLALSNELDTADKRSSALAGECCLASLLPLLYARQSQIQMVTEPCPLLAGCKNTGSCK